MIDESCPGARLYSEFARDRTGAPARYDPDSDKWAFSTAADVRRAALDPTTFSSHSTFGLHPRVLTLMAGLFPDGIPDRARTLLNSDPPEHSIRRGLLSGVFTPAETQKRRGAVLALADELIDEFIDLGRVDLVDGFAQRLTARVIGSVIGLDRDFADRLPGFIDGRLSLYRNDLTDAEIISTLRGHREYCDGLQKHIDARRSAPKDDLLSRLVHAWPTLAERGVATERNELFALVNGIVLGGQETTANLIAIAVHEAGRRPGLLARIAADPALVRPWVEETLRYRSPVIGTNRTTARPVSVRGETIPKGTRVHLLWASANHDIADDERPWEFDIDRPARTHVAFGVGSHFCLGAPLARLEAEIALTRLTARLPGLRLARSEVSYVDSPIVYGPATLPVEWELP